MSKRQNDLDFLDKPLPLEPRRQYHNTPLLQQSLRGELRLALENWEERTYVQGTDWTSTNEAHRKSQIKTISRLLDWIDEKGFWTPKQEALVKKLIKNTFKD